MKTTTNWKRTTNWWAGKIILPAHSNGVSRDIQGPPGQSLLSRYLPQAGSQAPRVTFSLELCKPLPLMQSISGFGQKGGALQPAHSELSGLAPLSGTIQAAQQLRPQLQHLISEARMARVDRMSHCERKQRSRSNWVCQTRTLTKILEEISASLMMWLFYTLIPCLLIGKYELEYS